VCPCGVFVVESAVGEAAVEDADETVAEGAHCLVVEVSFGPALGRRRLGIRGFGSGSRTPTGRWRRLRRLPDVAGHHEASGTRRSGDRGRPGIVLARLDVGVSVRVIPELAEHPSAENYPESWLGTENVGAERHLDRLSARGSRLLGWPPRFNAALIWERVKDLPVAGVGARSKTESAGAR
jgi:hypothetical protein